MIRNVALALLLTLGALDGVAQPIEPIRPSKPVDRTDVALDKLTLFWTTPEHITSYKVQMSEDPTFSTLLPLKDATDIAPGKRGSAEYEVALTSGVIAKNREYFWRVIGKCEPNVRCPGPGNTQTSDTAEFMTAREPFAVLKAKGWSLSRGSSDEDKVKPAEFSFSEERHAKPIYSADYLLAWHRDHAADAHQASYSPYFSTQGALTDNPETTDASWNASIGARYDRSWQANSLSPVNSLIVTGSGRYEASQDGKTRKQLLDLTGTVTLHKLGIGRYVPWTRWFSVLWRPYLTVDWGHTSSRGDSAEEESRVERIVPQVAVAMRLHGIRRALNLRDVVLSMTDSAYWLPGEANKRHNLFDSSLDLTITKGFSVGVQFKSGKEAPKFAGQRTVGLTLGLGF